MSDRLPLLTISIPTYNRAADLDTALTHIAGQIGPVADQVEVLVSDNCSPDATQKVVEGRVAGGMKITYLRNQVNIGPDNNFVQCYTAAKGDYVWLLGDDDIVLDGAVVRVLDILKSGEYGVLSLNSYGFRKSLAAERPKATAGGHEVLTDTVAFMARANYFLTFISGNVVNKRLIGADLDVEAMRSTNLIQLAWTFEAIFKGKPNVYVKDYCVAAKADASGGYQLCRVFGKNFLDACEIYIRKGVPPENFEVVKKKLLLKFFPANIIRARKNILATKPENYFAALYPLYKGYLYFWVFTVPAIILPLWPAFAIFRAADWLRKQLR